MIKGFKAFEKKSKGKNMKSEADQQVVSISKEEYEKQQEVKINGIKKLNKYLKLLNFKNLHTTIQAYGYDYSFSKYLTSIVLLLSGIVFSGYLFKLKIESIVFLGVFAICCLPIIILSQIRFLYNNYRFEQITTYLQEMITTFKIKPKILAALTEVRGLFTSGISSQIDEAIECIKEGTGISENVYYNALKIIQDKYPCSRIKSLHSLLITVENQNSENYQDAINDLYEDIRAWTSRTYNYQIELKNTKTQFSIVLLLTIGVSCSMVNILPAGMTTFVNGTVYQTATTIMLAIFLAMFCFMQSKLNGQWLVNDLDNDDSSIQKSIDYVENFDEKESRKKSRIKAALACVIPLIGFLQGNRNVMVLGSGVVLLLYFWDTLQYKKNFGAIEKEIKKVFPVWLRDVSLNMHNLTVTNAIRQSYQAAPTVLKYYLANFISEVEQDPVTIRPYNNFLKKFYINDISSSMKTLYSIKQQDSSQSSRLISDLIIRNQGLMETSERIRNENQIAGLNMLGSLPMIVGALKLCIDMVLMILEFMTMTNNMIGTAVGTML